MSECERDPGTDATPLKAPHDYATEPIEHETINLAELLMICERLWRIARHPMGDPIYATLRPRLLKARVRLETKPVSMIRDFWLEEIDRYLPKAKI